MKKSEAMKRYKAGLGELKTVMRIMMALATALVSCLYALRELGDRPAAIAIIGVFMVPLMCQFGWALIVHARSAHAGFAGGLNIARVGRGLRAYRMQGRQSVVRAKRKLLPA